MSERASVRLLPGLGKRFRSGHPWVYSNEIRMDEAARAIAPGSVVRIVDDGGTMLACATFNPHSLIAARHLDPDPECIIDAGFIALRLRRALGLRERLYDGPYYRLVHAEADGLPGLVIDRFGDCFVCQANTAGAEGLMPTIVGALRATFAPRGIVLRGDSPVRALEGLPSAVSCVGETPDATVPVLEGAARFLADPLHGQKTGWFYDQRDNRAFMARLAKGLSVLDVYCHGGGFGVTALLAGAREALFVDSSEPALKLAAGAAALNGCADRARFVRAEAFRDLEDRARNGERFGMVVADPPSFVKSRRDLAVGARGYRKLTRLAAALVDGGGFLFIASCSHLVDVPTFADQVRRGLHDARRDGRVIHTAAAGPDHPVHPALPESAYLKALVLQLD